MDYEKKYKEALKRVKKYYDMGSQPSHSDLEYIFPELRESEDEKARKELISYLNAVIKEVGDLGHPQIDRWIAYLEKQKEQKLAWNEEDETIIEGACSALKIHGHDKLASKLKSLRPQPKQEWGEEDEKILEHISNVIDANYAGADWQRMIDWLNNLRPQPRWKPSEEDERILKGIIGKIDHDQTYGVSKAEMLSFLKSLRTQSYMSRRVEDLYDGLANTYRIDAK